jgi:hypothetical protein
LPSEVGHRRLSTAVTLTVLVALLAAGAIIGFRSLFAPIKDSSKAEPAPTCTPQKVDAGKRITAREVTVSVFNASNRSGLASATLNQLADRGFQAGDAGNAPEGTRVRTVEVWTTEQNDAAAKLVALQFGRSTKVRKGEDLGPGIDVVVGTKFKGPVKAPKTIKSSNSQEVCVSEE